MIATAAMFLGLVIISMIGPYGVLRNHASPPLAAALCLTLLIPAGDFTSRWTAGAAIMSMLATLLFIRGVRRYDPEQISVATILLGCAAGSLLGVGFKALYEALV